MRRGPMEGHASLDHGENDGENAVIGNHAALGDRADAGGKSTITAAEKRVLQNMNEARFNFYTLRLMHLRNKDLRKRLTTA